ncbi:MAG: hypothetical protein WAO56_01510 [Miniphocaeibacter sp.]|uniref:hypothetical protein n=1 Tax=Miniphocaeibacter sp. TaxID=3100973 RepID=UPI00180118D1|nr:hypothetical protein [Gallicola sp.]
MKKFKNFISSLTIFKSTTSRIIGFIFLTFLIIIFLFLYLAIYQITNIDEKHYKENSFYFQEIGTSFGFGPASIKIVYENKKIKTKKNLIIDNDGARLSEDSWEIIWNKEYALLTLKGDYPTYDKFKVYYKNGKFEEIRDKVKYKDNDKDPVDTEKQENAYLERINQENKKIEKEQEELKNQYRNLSAFLKEEGERLTEPISFDYTSKGQLYALVYKEKDNSTKNFIIKTIIFNESFFDDNKIEFVYYKSKIDENGAKLGDDEILGFYRIDKFTEKITNENRKNW